MPPVRHLDGLGGASSIGKARLGEGWMVQAWAGGSADHDKRIYVHESWLLAAHVRIAEVPHLPPAPAGGSSLFAAKGRRLTRASAVSVKRSCFGEEVPRAAVGWY
jgi:hypothetical protein